MDSPSRHAVILDRLHASGRVDVGELAVELDTSEVTVRRDLDLLAGAGVLRRVRGGAVSLLLRGQELPFALRETSASGEKERMAAAVAGLLRDGEAVVVDSGTTGLAVARALVGRSLTVTPLSVHAAAALVASSTVQVLLPGGTARPGEGALVGPMAESALRGLRYDTTVLTCCGVSAEAGVMAYDVQDAAVKRTAAQVAARTVLVAEGAKLARTALAVVCPVAELDVLVTDTSAPPDALDRIREAGVEVVQA
ncbi:DeoR/GlpR family DNA-binding transcription regulator [Motilibacter rhizosphaerae]|nr:DeoR/GlpR family DNA-binding transcription regulator [Motilibacter rhizosphaerae]